MRPWPLLALLAPLVRAQDRETFSEKLWIEPFEDGKLLAQFEFKTVLDDVPRRPDTLNVEDSTQHYTVVPLALGQVLREYSVTELHLALNSGKWNYKAWGVPPVPSVASGAELWAWMGHTHDDTSENVDARWRGLTNALAGLFCASLGSMDDRRTIVPDIAFRPEGDLPGDYPHSLRYATIPSENVCTENLTPFVKLLPCKAHAGIASLLNPHRLFDADWHGMSITVRWLESTGIELRLGFGAIMDPVRLNEDTLRRDWSFRLLFGRQLHRSCLIASKSNVLVGMGPTSEGSVLLPYGHNVHKISDTRSLAVYDVSRNTEDFELSQQWVDEPSFSYVPVLPQLPVTVRRVLTGAEQTYGGLLLTITNAGDTTFTTAWLETMPWFIQFFLHTLELRLDNQKRGNLLTDPCLIADDLLLHLAFTPPRDDLRRASVLEAVLSVPPHATLDVKVSFRKAFILYTEHQPDAHRGWDLPGAILTPLCSEGSNNSALTHTYGLGLSETSANVCGSRMYTSTLLVDLATPDFSMPYNVIIMTSTVVALFFGSIFNLLTRKFVVVRAAAGKFKEARVEFIPFETITRTFEAACQNSVDYACVPLENSLHGGVVETLDLLRANRPSEHDVTIAGEFTMGIEHCLITCQGVELKGIQRVLSHEQALGQCQDFLSRNLPGAIKVPTSSTAFAAEQILQLSKSGDPLAHHSAAICSRICVELHQGLQVLRSGIQDGETNFTRFVIASKKPVPSQVQPDTLQRALVRCVLPVDNDLNPRTTLSSIIRLLPEGVDVARVDRRPSLSKTPFHDCVFLELASNPPLVPDSPNCDVNHVWGIKVSLAAITINKAVGGDTPCCRVLGAW